MKVNFIKSIALLSNGSTNKFKSLKKFMINLGQN